MSVAPIQPDASPNQSSPLARSWDNATIPTEPMEIIPPRPSHGLATEVAEALE